MRVVLRLLARLLGLALAGVGVLLALEAGSALVQPHAGPLLVPWPRWRDTVAGYTWAETEVLVGAGVLVGIGALFLLVAGLAGRRTLRLVDPAEAVSVVTSPRALGRFVGHRVREQEEVGTASVTTSRRRVRVRATSALRPAAQLQPALAGTVHDLVADLPLVRRPRVRVSVRSSRRGR